MTEIEITDNTKIGGNKLNSKLDTAIDSNVIANGIMHDIIDIDRMEKMPQCELTSSDLFKIDCGILAQLKVTEDFSKNLLKQLESGKFEEMSVKPQKSIDFDVQNIQQQVITDITLPLQKLFDDMTDFVSEALT